MQHIRKVVFVLLVILISFCFVISCDNTSNYTNGSEVTIIEPSFDTATGEEKELVSATIQIDTYKIKMIPQWNMADTGVPIYGSTKGKGDDDYITISSSDINNIGYYTQGIWKFGLKAYSNNKLVYYVPEKDVEINSNKRTIPIDASEVVYSSSNALCTVLLDQFDLLFVDSFDKYYSENKEYRITYSMSPVTANGSTISETEIVFDENTSHTNTIATVSNLTVSGESGISAGTYVISISYYQKVNGSWKKDGGTSYGFTAIPGATMIIKGSADIDLYPNRYVSVGTGESGIIIDSGTNATITIDTDLTASSTVTDKTAVTFTGEVDGTVTSGQWFVNGVSTSSGSTFTYTPTGMSGKTVTITYMILDSTYNTISANYYLTVSTSTTTSSTTKETK